MIFEIGELHPNTPHLLADIAELLLLINYLGRSTLHKNDLESLLNTGLISSEELDDEKEAKIQDDVLKRSTAEKTTRLEDQLEDVLIQLAYRSKALLPYYPFSVKNETIKIVDELSEEHRVYRFLLACSRLRSFKGRGVPQRWARSFARLSNIAMGALAPMQATSRIFDANSDDRRHYYDTDLRLALPILGQDLGVISVNHDECRKADSSGDAGFDIVATLPFDDGAATNFAILGQCGSQEIEWPKKTLEAHSLNCRSYFQIQYDYPNVMFTPICYRNATGEWVNNKCSNGVLVLDRIRILSLLGSTDDWRALLHQEWFGQFENEFRTAHVP